jgi:hypothetical protein
MAAGSTYTPISTYTVPSNTSSVALTSISSSYTDLIVRITGVDSNGYVFVRLNTDNGTNYSRTYLGGNGTSAYSGRSSNVNEEYVALASSTLQTLTFLNYSNSTTYKTSIIDESQSTSRQVTIAMWRNTNAINRIEFISPSGTSSIQTGTVISLYGIAAA